MGVARGEVHMPCISAKFAVKTVCAHGIRDPHVLPPPEAFHYPTRRLNKRYCVYRGAPCIDRHHRTSTVTSPCIDRHHRTHKDTSVLPLAFAQQPCTDSFVVFSQHCKNTMAVRNAVARYWSTLGCASSSGPFTAGGMRPAAEGWWQIGGSLLGGTLPCSSGQHRHSIGTTAASPTKLDQVVDLAKLAEADAATIHTIWQGCDSSYQPGVPG